MLHKQIVYKYMKQIQIKMPTILLTFQEDFKALHLDLRYYI